MRSTQSTRDQLLAVAVAEFARDGFEKTSVRSIAKAAGTSAALVIHYFGTKDLLVKEALIKTLGEWIGEEKAALIKDQNTRISDWVSLVTSGEIKLQFMRQVLLADNEYTKSLFEYALLETKSMLESGPANGVIEKVEDIEAVAALLTSQALAHMIFLPQLEAALGGPISDPVAALRLMKAQQELMFSTFKQPKNEESK